MRRRAPPPEAFAAVEPEPDRRPPLAEQVARRILDLIRSGNLRPGDRLPPDRDLAAMLGVGHPAVREALQALAILGVLDRARGGRSVVAAPDLAALLTPLRHLLPLNPGTIDTYFQARLFVEGGIGRMAATRIAPAAIDRLRRLVEVQAHLAADPIGFRVSDLEFHQTLLDACQNPFLDQIGNSLYEMGMEYRRAASAAPGVIAQSVADHAEIVAALAARDPERAGRAMERHVENVDRSTRAAMQLLAPAAMQVRSERNGS